MGLDFSPETGLFFTRKWVPSLLSAIAGGYVNHIGVRGFRSREYVSTPVRVDWLGVRFCRRVLLLSNRTRASPGESQRGPSPHGDPSLLSAIAGGYVGVRVRPNGVFFRKYVFF